MKKSKKRIRKQRKWAEGIHGVEGEGGRNLRRDGRLGRASNGWSVGGSGKKSVMSRQDKKEASRREGKVL